MVYSGSSWREHCWWCQGLQLCTDNASFGSFANSLLTAFRDEFPKHPTLMFAVLSDAVPGDLDVDDVSSTLRSPVISSLSDKRGRCGVSERR